MKNLNALNTYLNSIGHPLNSKIYNREKTESSIIVNYQMRRCACGKIGKIKVQWPDGSFTLLCPKGLTFDGQDWKIS